MQNFNENEVEYAGFWIRLGASLIDGILLIMLTYPLLFLVYGSEYLDSEKMILGTVDLILSWMFPIIGTIAFWAYRAGTPGKLVLGLSVIDAKTGELLTVPQAIGRYFAYIPSMLPLLMGIFWVGWDSKKQGWHDKLAGTVVIRKKNHTEKVVFSK
jgi:uncharacterized RDD family membrane protein YckC